MSSAGVDDESDDISKRTICLQADDEEAKEEVHYVETKRDVWAV